LQSCHHLSEDYSKKRKRNLQNKPLAIKQALQLANYRLPSPLNQRDPHVAYKCPVCVAEKQAADEYFPPSCRLSDANLQL
jgi:hypothetical protein